MHRCECCRRKARKRASICIYVPAHHIYIDVLCLLASRYFINSYHDDHDGDMIWQRALDSHSTSAHAVHSILQVCMRW